MRIKELRDRFIVGLYQRLKTSDLTDYVEPAEVANSLGLEYAPGSLGLIVSELEKSGHLTVTGYIGGGPDGGMEVSLTYKGIELAEELSEISPAHQDSPAQSTEQGDGITGSGILGDPVFGSAGASMTGPSMGGPLLGPTLSQEDSSTDENKYVRVSDHQESFDDLSEKLNSLATTLDRMLADTPTSNWLNSEDISHLKAELRATSAQIKEGHVRKDQLNNALRDSLLVAAAYPGISSMVTDILSVLDILIGLL